MPVSTALAVRSTTRSRAALCPGSALRTRLNPNGKFVLRGGYGITNFLEGTGANLRLTLNPPFFVDSSCTVRWNRILPDPEWFPASSRRLQLSGNVRAWQPNLKPALIQQYNLTTEYQVNNTTSLTVAYLGQDGNHLVDPREGNQALPRLRVLPVTSLLRPSQVSQVSYTESDSIMNYNALQITARHRLTRRARVPRRLHLQQDPHQQPRLLRRGRRCGCLAKRLLAGCL